jgi:hypothetical protein
MNNKELNHLNLPPATQTNIYFVDKTGKECEEKFALAKTVTSNYGYDNVSKQFFIRYGRAELIDPYGVDSGVSIAKLSSLYKFKKVSEKAYSAYLKYLKSKNRIHFTTARRLIME